MALVMDKKRRDLPRIRVAKAIESLEPTVLLLNKGRDLCLRLLQQVEEGRFVLKVPPPRRFEPAAGRPLFAVALKGRNHFSFQEEKMVLGAGEMAILPGHAVLKEENAEEDRESLTVTLYPQAIGLALHQTGEPIRLQVASSGAVSLGHYLGQIIELGRRSEWQAKLGAKGLLLAYLSVLEAAMPRPTRREPLPALEKVRVAEVRRLVQEELANPELGVVFLAQRLRCSPDYLSHLFRQETGQRLAAYINKERIEAAKELLRHTALNVAEIAFAVGFENPGYFARVFKVDTGTAPGDYRRSLDRTGGKGKLV